MSPLRLCCGLLIERLTRPLLRDSDSDLLRNRKHALVTTMLVAFIGSAVGAYGLQPFNNVADVGTYVAMAACVLAYLAALSCGFSFSAKVLVGLMFCATILIDWMAVAQARPRTWSFIVPILDGALMLEMSDHVLNSLLGSTLLWMLVTQIDQTVHFGMNEAHNFGGEYVYPDMCNCAKPPCSETVGAGVNAFITFLMVFLIDYYFTRSFAKSMQQQMRLVQASVLVAYKVTQHLAWYEVDKAQEVVGSLDGAALPDQLRESFEQLLSNLRSYKPYLPHACLSTDNRTSDCSSLSQSASTRKKDLGRSMVQQQPSESVSVHATRDDILERSAETSADAQSWISSSMGSSTSVLYPRVQGSPRSRVGQDPATKNVTLLCVNRVNFEAVLATLDVCEWFTAEVSRFTEPVVRHKGVVDELLADHFFASFNALQSTGMHRAAGSACAVEFMSKPERRRSSRRASARVQIRSDASLDDGHTINTAALCSGRALCGDFGNNEMRKFMILGSVSGLLLVLERVSRQLNTKILCDTVVCRDIAQQYKCKLCLYAEFSKFDHGRQFGLYEITGTLRASGEAEEWMYELDKREPNPWAPYNAAMRMWVHGNVPGATAGVENMLAACQSATVRAAAHELLRRIGAGDKPVAELVEAGVLGGAREASLPAIACDV
eukprot:TRINITY_DN9532_c0_g1_i1.p1 TRINITY_DN9532_c0_g1~~TRINITY_DN9532_c0_g1_i1.p1  ORF type:complete len:693 (+),score=141.26 TRINITY_DN9532_c0_g1_i1:90-2081(+)